MNATLTAVRAQELCEIRGGRPGLIVLNIVSVDVKKLLRKKAVWIRARELCGSRGGRPGLPVLNSLMVSVDVKQH